MFIDTAKKLEESLFLGDLDEVSRKDPIVLAYIGDSLYDLYVRTRLVSRKDYKVNSLHKMAIAYVCANGQAKSLDKVMDMLTEEELNIVRRGKNAKTTPPKNCDRTTYFKATAFEALAGYLYLSNQNDRIEELFEAAFER